jgi:redox-sensitive bicupin YhaK (pirin superfamily)
MMIPAAGAGFGTHGHANMEIITIPLEGGLMHKDSMEMKVSFVLAKCKS